MIRLTKNTDNTTKDVKYILRKQKSFNSNASDIILNEENLDLIIGGVDPSDLQKAMKFATADMNLEELIPVLYFQE